MYSELQVTEDEWDTVLPLTECVINHRVRDILGGHSAVEVMTGLMSRTAPTWCYIVEST